MTRRHDDNRITLEAAQWLMELQTEGAACHTAFTQWLRRSPEHIQEFLAVSSMSLKLDGVDPQRRIDVDALLAQMWANVVELPATEGTRQPFTDARRTGRRKWAAGLAAACALIAVVVATRWAPFGTETYVTRVGEQRTVRLEDGSLVSLNTQSRVEVNFSDQAREVRLLEGEALFAVEHDPNRPFRVLSGSTTVQAIGTQFNVYRSAAGVKVFVVQGIVQVSTNDGAAGQAPAVERVAARITAGQQVEIRRGRVDHMEPADAASAIAWRERQLVFRDKPLSSVAAEFNRYNTTKFEIADDVSAEALSGVFAADRPESLALFLAKDPSLHVERHGDRFIIRLKVAADRR